MARWRVTPGTVGNTMTGTVDYGAEGDNTYTEIKQDISEIQREIQRDKDLLASGRENKHGFRKMATIPDIVALDMLQKHNFDLHDPMISQDPNAMKRLRYLLKTEYPDLLIAT